MNEEETAIKTCCQLAENLIEEPSEKAELVLRRCRVCRARHFELGVDPIALGLRAKSGG